MKSTCTEPHKKGVNRNNNDRSDCGYADKNQKR